MKTSEPKFLDGLLQTGDLTMPKDCVQFLVLEQRALRKRVLIQKHD